MKYENDRMQIQQRFRQIVNSYMDMNEINLREFTDRTKVDYKQFAVQLKGTRDVTSENIHLVCMALKINFNYLHYGAGPVYLEREINKMYAAEERAEYKKKANELSEYTTKLEQEIENYKIVNQLLINQLKEKQ